MALLIILIIITGAKPSAKYLRSCVGRTRLDWQVSTEPYGSGFTT